MNALLHLPPRDDLTLTPEELSKITGTPMAKLQIEWLTSNRWIHSLTRGGQPVVGRLYANLKLAGVEASNIVTTQEWMPDMASIN